MKGSAGSTPAAKITPKTSSVKKSRGTQESSIVTTFAVQCNNCLKWRRLATQEHLEEFRCKQTEDPFVCDKLPGISCDNPADITYDSSRVWAMDKPDIPKTPKGFHRSVSLRRDYSRLDVNYVTPHGTKIRTGPEMAHYLQQHPECSHISPSDFSFASPKVMRDTVPKDDVKIPTDSIKKRQKSK